MKKVLLVTWGGIHYGGVQLLLLDLLSHMDRSDLCIDLYTFGGIDSSEIYDRFTAFDIKVITGGHRYYDRSGVARDLYSLIGKGCYDVVHSNTGSPELTAIVMSIAWLFRTPVRVAHSHNPKQNDTPYRKMDRVYQFLNRNMSTVRLACSRAAARHVFGEKGAGRCKLLKNGIEPEKYRFDALRRELIRHELELDHFLAIGHVGRFEKQKNHDFLIDVFFEVRNKRDNAVLLLIGEGSLLPLVQEKVERMGLAASVKFLGVTDRVADYLQAMDVFVLPSVFEGLGIAAIEAQAADLPVVCSDAIPDEARVTPRFLSLPLYESAGKWSERILEEADAAGQRADRASEIRNAGYDIADSAKTLQQIYWNQQ